MKNGLEPPVLHGEDSAQASWGGSQERVAASAVVPGTANDLRP